MEATLPAMDPHQPWARRGRMVALLILLAGLVVAGCAQPQRGARASDLDRQFIDMMVPHHQGAVEMAKIAQARAQRTEIKEIAVAIIRSQDREIEQMRDWRRTWFGSDQTP